MVSYKNLLKEDFTFEKIVSILFSVYQEAYSSSIFYCDFCEFIYKILKSYSKNSYSSAVGEHIMQYDDNSITLKTPELLDEYNVSFFSKIRHVKGTFRFQNKYGLSFLGETFDKNLTMDLLFEFMENEKECNGQRIYLNFTTQFNSSKLTIFVQDAKYDKNIKYECFCSKNKVVEDNFFNVRKEENMASPDFKISCYSFLVGDVLSAIKKGDFERLFNGDFPQQLNNKPTR